MSDAEKNRDQRRGRNAPFACDAAAALMEAMDAFGDARRYGYVMVKVYFDNGYAQSVTADTHHKRRRSPPETVTAAEGLSAMS